MKCLAGLVGNPPTACPAATYVLVDEDALDGSENERGDAQAHGDGGHGYDGNVMTMSASNGLGFCGFAQWFDWRRWSDAAGGGMVRLLGRRLPACHHFEEMLPDLMGYLEAEDRNSLGGMFPQGIGQNREGLWRMRAQMEHVAEGLGRGDGFQERTLVQVRSVVGVHDKSLVAGPVLAKVESRILGYEEVRYIQEPSQRLDTVFFFFLKKKRNYAHSSCNGYPGLKNYSPEWSEEWEGMIGMSMLSSRCRWGHN